MSTAAASRHRSPRRRLLDRAAASHVGLRRRSADRRRRRDRSRPPSPRERPAGRRRGPEGPFDPPNRLGAPTPSDMPTACLLGRSDHEGMGTTSRRYWQASEPSSRPTGPARPPDQRASGISFGNGIGEGTGAVDRFSQVAAHDRLQEVLADVLRAQEKLDESQLTARATGAAGRSPERLDTLPWATRCVACAAKRD